MVARPKKATKPAEPEPEEEANERTPRSAGEMHELFADFVTEETGVEVTAEQVFAITSKRVAFRQSEAYTTYRDSREEEREGKEAEKAKRAQEREAAAAAKAAEPKASRKKKADPAEDGEEEAGTVTPMAGRRGRKASTAAAENEDGEETPKPTARRGRPAKAGSKVPF